MAEKEPNNHQENPVFAEGFSEGKWPTIEFETPLMDRLLEAIDNDPNPGGGFDTQSMTAIE